MIQVGGFQTSPISRISPELSKSIWPSDKIQSQFGLDFLAQLYQSLRTRD